MNICLSLIIPAYNEAERLANSLQTVIEYLDRQNYTTEILLVDDGSIDNTLEIVANFGDRIKILGYKPNKGKGAAVKYGMLNANGDYCVFSDADLSTPIYELERMLAELCKGYDVVIGNRADDASLIKVHQPFYRELMGKTFNKIVKILVYSDTTDTQCGFKGFNRKAAKKIFSNITISGFGFDVEVLFLAKMFEFKVKQISVEWYNDERTKVNIIKDSVRMLLEILKIKKHYKDII